jgi:transcriptional regulator with XRE-family HTH domain
VRRHCATIAPWHEWLRDPRKFFYRGIAYWLDLTICRRALVDCQVLGELDSMESLADKVDISRSTASRFFSGRPTSLAVTLKILEALHLKFEDVARLADDDQPSQAGGAAGAGVARQPKPNNGQGGAARRPEEIERR